MADLETYKQEQEAELETLKCIYSSDEFTIMDETTFEIKLTSELDEVDEYSNVGRYGLIITFTYPPSYPEKPPLFELKSTFTTPAVVVTNINAKMENLVMNYVGQIMIYDLCSEVQQLLSDALGRVTDLSDGGVAVKEEVPPERYGTMVTEETFLDWSKKFRAEMAELKDKIIDTESGGKLTGRQLFERDEKLILSDMQFYEDSPDADIEAVEIDESLFQDLDGLELGDCD